MWMRDLINLVENAQSDLKDVRRQANDLGVELGLIDAGKTVKIKWIANNGPNRGAGKRIMQHLCDLADKHGVRLTLDVLDGAEDLISYYQQFGFKVDPSTKDDAEPVMTRQPVMTEAFDRGEVNWVDQNSRKWTAQWNAAGQTFEAIFYKRNNEEADEWGMFFHTEAGDTHNTGQGRSAATAVFAGAISAIEDFLNKVEPDYLNFSGDKEEGKATLYARMAGALSDRLKSHGYRIEQGRPEEGEKRQDFTIRRGVLAEVNLIGDFDDEINAGRKLTNWEADIPTTKVLGRVGEVTIRGKDFPEHNAALYFVMIGDRPIGKATVANTSEGWKKVKHIWFDPAYRGKGYGLAFYEFLIQNGQKVISDWDQTRHSKALWQRLARKHVVRPVFINDEIGQPVTDTSPFYGDYTRLLVSEK